MKLLVAVDGSEFSQAALNFLGGFPFDQPPEVTVAHVTFFPMMGGYADSAVADVARVYTALRTEGNELLQSAAESCRPWAQSVKTKLLEGSPAAELLQLAREEKPDLIVIGSRGQGAISRFFLGTVSEKVALYARCSVLVVRPSSHANGPVARNILFADDASDEISSAIDLFSELPLTAARHVCVLGVLEMLPTRGLEELIENNPYWQAQAQSLKDHLQSSEQKFTAAKVGFDSRLQKAQHIANEILETAAETETDLLVAGSAGKNAWERLLLGSVSTRLLRHAHCSVWIHRIPRLHSEERTLP